MTEICREKIGTLDTSEQMFGTAQILLYYLNRKIAGKTLLKICLSFLDTSISNDLNLLKVVGKVRCSEMK